MVKIKNFAKFLLPACKLLRKLTHNMCLISKTQSTVRIYLVKARCWSEENTEGQGPERDKEGEGAQALEGEIPPSHFLSVGQFCKSWQKRVPSTMQFFLLKIAMLLPLWDLFVSGGGGVWGGGCGGQNLVPPGENLGGGGGGGDAKREILLSWESSWSPLPVGRQECSINNCLRSFSLPSCKPVIF